MKTAKTPILPLFLLAHLLLACQSQKEADLVPLIQQGAILVDVRSSAEFAEDSVAGSINIPLDDLQVRHTELIGREKPIIVFCKSGSRARQAKMLLEENGITHVTNGISWHKVRDAQGKVEVQKAGN